MARTLSFVAFSLVLAMSLAAAEGVRLVLEVQAIPDKTEYDMASVPAMIENTGGCQLNCFYRMKDFKSEIGTDIPPGRTVDFVARLKVPQCPQIDCEVPIEVECMATAPESCAGQVFTDTKMIMFTNVMKYTGADEIAQQNGIRPQQNLIEKPQAGSNGNMFFFDQIRVELSSGEVPDVMVGEKETLKATLINERPCQIECSYKVQGTGYETTRITEGLSKGGRMDFNFIFFVPEGCREPCAVTAHVTCNDKQSDQCLDPRTHETDVSFDLVGIKEEDQVAKFGRLLVFILIGAAIAFGAWKAFGMLKGKKNMEREDESEGKRKLSAIMFTDVKGYSKEMGRDEESMLKKLWRYEKAMKQIVKEHDGRVVKTIGDAIMGDFDSAVNAVKAAMAIQDLLKKEDIKIRIGIHLGDVIHKGGDVFGDGVNIASRIESICEPGEIYISEDVYNQVKGKIRGDFQSLGRKPLKNIDVPPRVYKVR